MAQILPLYSGAGFERIAGLNEMTSTSALGLTTITIQFDLSRSIDAVAREVQAAINAARGQLPANLPSDPLYRKTNPADTPILMLSLTSDTVDTGRMYDVAASILPQRLSQVEGVGRVIVGGAALPAVRVDVNPTVLNSYAAPWASPSSAACCSASCSRCTRPPSCTCTSTASASGVSSFARAPNGALRRRTGKRASYARAVSSGLCGYEHASLSPLPPGEGAMHDD